MRIKSVKGRTRLNTLEHSLSEEMGGICWRVWLYIVSEVGNPYDPSCVPLTAKVDTGRPLSTDSGDGLNANVSYQEMTQ